MNGQESLGTPADDAHGPVRVHEPVMLRECLETLGLLPGMTVVDGTVGAGGHAAAFAAAVAPDGWLIGLDRDAEILAHAEVALLEARGRHRGPRVTLQNAPYAELAAVLRTRGIAACDRVFLDLGVSSLQLDSPSRGFSFMRDGPLDMRMGQDPAVPTAADWLRTVRPAELERVLREFGEERFAGRIARTIVEARRRHRIERTSQLSDLVVGAVPGPARHGRIHAATRTFQAIRIAVNDELGQLERGLEAALSSLREGGRLAVLTFHSLEDRIVKRFLREHTELPFRKPIVADEAECARNPRARSAKLRCGIRRAAA
jgi:16S rRNA (cytosine1402-N4)-methyltransferase